MSSRRLISAALGLSVVAAATALIVETRTQAAPQTTGSLGTIDSDDLGGTVTSTKGPEAGVWVIAETS